MISDSRKIVSQAQKETHKHPLLWRIDPYTKFKHSTTTTLLGQVTLTYYYRLDIDGAIKSQRTKRQIDLGN